MAFLIPTEIFPSNLRAQGNGFGITGWAIGVGMTTLVNPIMFGSLHVSLTTCPLCFHANVFSAPELLLPCWSESDLDPHRLPLYESFSFPRRSELIVCLTVYPETRNRSLESIEALFSTTSPFHWKMEQAYKLRGDVLAEHGVSKAESYAAGKAELTTDNPEPGCANV